VITPGLVKRALVRAAQWRLFVFAPLVLLLPTAAALVPIARFLGEQFDHAPRWKELTARLDSAAFTDLVKVLGQKDTGAQLSPGFQLGFLLMIALSPLLAGAALTAAGKDEPPTLRELFQGAAGLYGRLLRMEVASLIPYGLGVAALGGLGAWQGKLAEKALTQAQVTSTGRWFNAAMVVLAVVSTLLVDAGRAWFIAQPQRRSAFFALGAGVKLVFRRPIAALAVSIAPSLVGLGLAAAVVLLRQQITQSGGGAVLLALALGLLASALVSYSHAARLCGLVELAQSDAADRVRAAPVRFEMEPPKTSPPPVRDVPVTMPVDYGPSAEPQPEVEPALDDTSAALAVAFGAPARSVEAPVAPPAPAPAVGAPVFTPLAAPELSVPPPVAAAPFLESPLSAPPPPAAPVAAAEPVAPAAPAPGTTPGDSGGA
jgi:hypothetical protein